VGLENILFQPQAEQPREFYAIIPIRLDLIGTYHKLGVFFDSMSKLNRILKVENLTMTRQKGASVLQVGCTVMTYRFLEKPAEAPGAPKKK
jgi:type IV pilus assembly protein PilO